MLAYDAKFTILRSEVSGDLTTLRVFSKSKHVKCLTKCMKEYFRNNMWEQACVIRSIMNNTIRKEYSCHLASTKINTKNRVGQSPQAGTVKLKGDLSCCLAGNAANSSSSIP